MKLGWKIVGIAAAVLLVLGIALIAVAYVTGGTPESLRNNVVLTDYAQSFPEETPTALDLEIDAGRLRLLSGGTLRVEAENVPEDGFVCTLEDGVLTVRENLSASWSDELSQLMSMRKQDPEIRIYLPEDTKLTRTEMQISAGDVQLGALDTAALTLDMRAGVLRAEGLRTDEAVLKLTAGTAAFTELDAQALHTEMAAGELSVSGSVKNSCTVEIAAGSAELKLLGTAADYTAFLNAGVGAIDYNGHSYSMEKAFVGKGTGNMELENSVGSIRVEFFG